MWSSFRSAARLLGLVLILIAAPANAAEPTAQELVARAPVIRSDDPTIKTIALSGYSRNDQGRIQMAFRAFYKAPDQFAFAQFDGRDGTPIAFAAGRNLLVYDPVKPELVVVHGVRGHADLDLKDGRTHVVFGGFDFKSDRLGSIVVDLKALFNPAPDEEQPADVRVLKSGEQQYTLVSRFHDAYRRARIDLTRPQPFTSFETAQSPTGEPNLCISTIVVNGAVSDDVFRFPALDRIATGLAVSETGAHDGLARQMGAVAAMGRVVYIRTHEHESTLNRGFLAPAMLGVRWGRVARNDAVHAAAVRALVPVAAEHRDYERPMKTDDPDAIQHTSFEALKQRLPSLPIKFQIKFKTSGDQKDD